MKHLFFSISFLLLAGLTVFGQEARVGEPLPVWKEGELDIHFINTGRGESTYQILPDGTTFLVDAGGVVSKNKSGNTPARPSADVTAGKAIANYINHFSPAVSRGHINYFLLTHHHADHMGGVNDNVPWHSNNRFKLTSLCEVGSLLVMDKIFDRTYPDFTYPKEDGSFMMVNYQTFLRWTKQKNKTKIEKWDVGSNTQVVPIHDKSCGVTIRNITGNGCVWTGNGNESVSFVPPKQLLDLKDKKDFPDGNVFSCSYMLSYGKFDFFIGGDLQHAFAGDQKEVITYDAESPMVSVVHKVEVMQANHHGCTGTHPTALINKLAPDVWVVGTWNMSGQPNRKPTRRVIEANPNVDIFSYYQSNKNLGWLVSECGLDEIDRHMVGRSGHIVVRVAPGGDSYMVYTLDDTNEEYRVKSIHGPYMCSDN